MQLIISHIHAVIDSLLYTAPAAKRVCPTPNAAPVSGLLVMRDNVRYTVGNYSHTLVPRFHTAWE